jgi:glutamyl-tRNA reductase
LKQITAFGINHKTAPVSFRERVAMSDDVVVDTLAVMQTAAQVSEVVIVSTCNRTEIYLYGGVDSKSIIVNYIASLSGISPTEIEQYSYCYHQQDAVKHLIRVASGLDSLVLGEPQILGQIKQSFALAKASGTVSQRFQRLFQHTFSVAKKVRSDTDIGANAVSVAYVAVQLAKHLFSSLADSRALIIGAGETSELVVKHLFEQGVKDITVANRTLEKALRVAKPVAGKVLTLSQIPHHLADADIVISSTASQLPILGKGVVERALKQRRHEPIFLVDLAVPRDIESEVAELSDAYVYTVDDLQNIVESNIASRQEAAAQAEDIIHRSVDTFFEWQEIQANSDVLVQYRQQSELQKSRLVDKALNQIADGKSAQEVIVELSNKLMNQLIHGPTHALKQASSDQHSASFSLLSRALGLDTHETQHKK